MTIATVQRYKRPCLLIIFGPPAVGKMTVAHALSKKTKFKVLHNHMTIDLVTHFFDFGTPAFRRLNEALRFLILEELSNAGQDTIVTVAWRADISEDKEIAARYARPFILATGTVLFLELRAGLDTRLRRNTSEHRKHHKRLEWATADYLRKMDREHRYYSDEDFPHPAALLTLSNEHLSAEQVADIVIERFNISVSSESV